MSSTGAGAWFFPLAPVETSVYDRLGDLEVRIDDVDWRRQRVETTGGFTRVSTTVELAGETPDGVAHVGRGEDVTYDAVDHDRLVAVLDDLPIRGTYTLRSLAAHLDALALFPEEPERAASRHYRRWAIESAALDLALRQAETSLGEALGRDYDPVRFVVSPNLTGGGDGPPTAEPVRALRAVHEDIGVKLDASPDWDDDLVDALAETGAVEVVDLKGHYEDADVATVPDPELYRRVREGFPAAVLEDPKLTPATQEALAGAEDRLSWDYPITDVASVGDLPVEPEVLNCKPSRFGTLEALFEFIAFCEAEGIRLYGGGQFELDVGRGQIQALASLCYPDGPNDVAPAVYNDSSFEGTPPGSPLSAPASEAGFGYDPASASD